MVPRMCRDVRWSGCRLACLYAFVPIGNVESEQAVVRSRTKVIVDVHTLPRRMQSTASILLPCRMQNTASILLPDGDDNNDDDTLAAWMWSTAERRCIEYAESKPRLASERNPNAPPLSKHRSFLLTIARQFSAGHPPRACHRKQICMQAAGKLQATPRGLHFDLPVGRDAIALHRPSFCKQQEGRLCRKVLKHNTSTAVGMTTVIESGAITCPFNPVRIPVHRSCRFARATLRPRRISPGHRIRSMCSPQTASGQPLALLRAQ